MAFSIVIPFYQDEKNYELFFYRNFECITAHFPETEMILVDDTGNDFLYRDIHRYPTARIITHDHNLGFARSVNDGIEQCYHEIVFVFNSDIQLTESAFVNTLPHFNQSTIFAVSLRSNYPNGEIREGAKRMIWKNGLPQIKHSPRDFPKPNSKNQILSFYPVGGHFAVRKSMFTSIGGYDTLTFHPFYWEDTDLGLRAQRNNWVTLYEPEAVVIHPTENSSIRNNFRSDYISRIQFRHRIFFALKNYAFFPYTIYLRLGLLLRWLSSGSYKLTWALIKDYRKTVISNRN